MHTPFGGYNERVQKVNTLLQEALQNINLAQFWRHRGLVNPAKSVFARNGIHSNDFGNEALNRSYRRPFYLHYPNFTKGPESTGSLLLFVVSGSKFCGDLH